MNRDEARALIETRRTEGEHKRPQASEPDRRPAAEQVHGYELARFETQLAVAAAAFEKRFGHWPLPGWFAHHRKRFGRLLERQEQATRQGRRPCKHWERSLADSPLLPELRRLWAQSLVTFALRYPYLGSPSSPCECRRCSSVSHLERRISDP